MDGYDRHRSVLTEQWYDCPTNSFDTGTCSAISGANGTSYQLTSSDVGDYVAVFETATTRQHAVATPPPPTCSGPCCRLLRDQHQALPEVARDRAAGRHADARHQARGTARTHFGHRVWLECKPTCSQFRARRRHNQDQLHAGVRGRRQPRSRSQETASTGGTPQIATVELRPRAVDAAELRSTSDTRGSDRGSRGQGQTLTAPTRDLDNHPDLLHLPVGSVHHQHSCTPISGANAATFQPTSAQAGDTIEVEVTGVERRWQPGQQSTSAPTAAITAPLTEESAPAITGTAMAGQTLSETNATWSLGRSRARTSGTAARGRRSRALAIAGATAQTYAIPNPTTLVGAYLEVVETASSGGGSASAVSPLTAPVTNAQAIIPVPVVQSASRRFPDRPRRDRR